MATIPTFIASGNRPVRNARRIDPGLFGGVGEALTQTGQTLFDASQRMADAQRNTQLTKTLGQATADLLEMRVRFSEDPDFWTSEDRMTKEVEKYKNKKLGELQDPEVVEKFTSSFDHQSQIALLNVRHASRQRQIADNKVQIDRALDSYSQSYWVAQSPQEKELITGEMKKLLDEGTKYGDLTEEEAHRSWTAMARDLKIGDLSRRLESDPQGALQDLDEGKYADLGSNADQARWRAQAKEGARKKQFAAARLEIDRAPEKADEIIDRYGLDPEHAAFLQDRAERRIEKKEREEGKKKLTIAHKSLVEEFQDENGEPDFDQIYRSLRNPEKIEALGLTIEQAHGLETIIGGQQAKIETDRRIRQDANFTNFLVQHDLKRLSLPDVTYALSKKDLSPEQHNYLKGQIERPREVKTDNAYWAKMFDAALAAKTTQQFDKVKSEILSGADTGKLSGGDVQELYRFQASRKEDIASGKKEHYTHDPWFTLAKDEMRNILIGQVELDAETAVRNKLSGISTPKKNFDHYYEAVSTLMRSVEKNALKGEDIWKKAQELIKVYSAKSAREAPSAPQAAPPGPSPKRQPGETVEQYLKRTRSL